MQNTESTSFRSLTLHFNGLYSVGVTLETNTQWAASILAKTHLFMVAMPTTRFSPIDGRSSQSASSWAGVCAHTENCLVNFYYYDQTAQSAHKCRTAAAERPGDGKCTINAVGKVYTGKK